MNVCLFCSVYGWVWGGSVSGHAAMVRPLHGWRVVIEQASSSLLCFHHMFAQGRAESGRVVCQMDRHYSRVGFAGCTYHTKLVVWEC